MSRCKKHNVSSSPNSLKTVMKRFPSLLGGRFLPQLVGVFRLDVLLWTGGVVSEFCFTAQGSIPAALGLFPFVLHISCFRISLSALGLASQWASTFRFTSSRRGGYPLRIYCEKPEGTFKPLVCVDQLSFVNDDLFYVQLNSFARSALFCST